MSKKLTPLLKFCIPCFWQMVTLLRNPYTWGKNGIGKILTPTVSSIHYSFDNKEMKVNNLPSGDELVVQIPTPNTEVVSKQINIIIYQLNKLNQTLLIVCLVNQWNQIVLTVFSVN